MSGIKYLNSHILCKSSMNLFENGTISHPKLERERFLMSFSFCFSPMRRAALFALDSSLGQGENLFSGSCGIRCRQCSSHFWYLWHSLQAMLFSFLPFAAFGTGEGLLRYGIRIRCSKRLPVVRDSFSEAFGVKNRLLRYRRDIRYRKRPPTVRDRTCVLNTGFPPDPSLLH